MGCTIQLQEPLGGRNLCSSSQRLPGKVLCDENAGVKEWSDSAEMPIKVPFKSLSAGLPAIDLINAADPAPSLIYRYPLEAAWNRRLIDVIHTQIGSQPPGNEVVQIGGGRQTWKILLCDGKRCILGCSSNRCDLASLVFGKVSARSGFTVYTHIWPTQGERKKERNSCFPRRNRGCWPPRASSHIPMGAHHQNIRAT